MVASLRPMSLGNALAGGWESLKKVALEQVRADVLVPLLGNPGIGVDGHNRQEHLRW